MVTVPRAGCFPGDQARQCEQLNDGAGRTPRFLERCSLRKRILRTIESGRRRVCLVNLAVASGDPGAERQGGGRRLYLFHTAEDDNAAGRCLGAAQQAGIYQAGPERRALEARSRRQTERCSATPQPTRRPS